MRQATWLLAALPLTLFSCSAARAEQSDDSLFRMIREQSQAINALEQAYAPVLERWDEVATHLGALIIKYDEIERMQNEVIAGLRAAEARFHAASETSLKAAQLWGVYRELVLLATAVDLASLRAARSGEAVIRVHYDCSSGMSTAAYRTLLAAAGVALADREVNHIWPASKGGADHPANYVLISKRLNRSLGNSWSRGQCAALFGAERCRQAVAVSKRCGPSARYP